MSHYEDTYKDLRDLTLCYLVDKEKRLVLIAMKKRGFGVGKLNGVGGKVKQDETVIAAMLRETEEEINVVPKNFEKVAEIRFYSKDNPNDTDMNQIAHVFLAYTWRGKPEESEEMAPQWAEIDNLPLEKMWEDDRYWLPKILDGKKLKASFLFDDKNIIVNKEVYEVDNFD